MKSNSILSIQDLFKFISPSIVEVSKLQSPEALIIAANKPTMTSATKQPPLAKVHNITSICVPVNQQLINAQKSPTVNAASIKQESQVSNSRKSIKKISQDWSLVKTDKEPFKAFRITEPKKLFEIRPCPNTLKG